MRIVFFKFILKVCGAESTFRLWHGISNSPISAVYSGYGIGSCLGVAFIMRFIKFNPITRLKVLSELNSTTDDYEKVYEKNKPVFSQIKRDDKTNITFYANEITSDEIKLVVPYSTAGCFGLFVAIGFICLHYIEKKAHIVLKKPNDAESDLIKNKIPETLIADDQQNKSLNYLNKLLFGTIFISKKVFYIKVFQLILLTLLSVILCSFVSINSAYMLSYTTRGPAKFSIESFFVLQILFWIFYLISRLITSFVAYRFNNAIFFLALLILNLSLSILYAIPYLNSIQKYCWLLITLLAFSTGPILPSCFMIAKYIFLNISAIILSIISIGMSIGFITSQYMTGYLLDQLKLDSNWFGYTDATSFYIIPYILVSYIFIALPIYLAILCIHNRFQQN